CTPLRSGPNGPARTRRPTRSAPSCGWWTEPCGCKPTDGDRGAPHHAPRHSAGYADTLLGGRDTQRRLGAPGPVVGERFLGATSDEGRREVWRQAGPGRHHDLASTCHSIEHPAEDEEPTMDGSAGDRRGGFTPG